MTDAATSTPLPRFATRASAVLLLVALPVFAFTSLPFAAWVVATALWLFGAAIHFAVRAAAARTTPNAAMGLAAGAMFVRMGAAMVTLLFVGASGDVDGTQFGMGEPDIALIALILYTMVFTLDMGERLALDSSHNHAAAALRGEEGT